MVTFFVHQNYFILFFHKKYCRVLLKNMIFGETEWT